MDEAAAQQQLANAHRHHHIKPLGGHWLTHFTVDSQLLLHFLLLLRHLLLLSTFFLLHPRLLRLSDPNSNFRIQRWDGHLCVCVFVAWWVCAWEWVWTWLGGQRGDEQSLSDKLLKPVFCQRKYGNGSDLPGRGRRQADNAASYWFCAFTQIIFSSPVFVIRHRIPLVEEPVNEH